VILTPLNRIFFRAARGGVVVVVGGGGVLTDYIGEG